jgi:hypothetical protein
MKNKNLITTSLALAVLLAVGLACGSLMPAKDNVNVAINTAPANSTSTANKNTAGDPKTETKKGIVSASDPVDFTFTAEEIYKQYKDDKESKLDDKYLDKIVVIKGRFKDFDGDKKDSTGGYSARLTAGGFLDWVSCSVDEESKEDFAKLKKDEMVAFKGMGENYWIGSPRFKHCIVVPAN